LTPDRIKTREAITVVRQSESKTLNHVFKNSRYFISETTKQQNENLAVQKAISNTIHS